MWSSHVIRSWFGYDSLSSNANQRCNEKYFVLGCPILVQRNLDQARNWEFFSVNVSSINHHLITPMKIRGLNLRLFEIQSFWNHCSTFLQESGRFWFFSQLHGFIHHLLNFFSLLFIAKILFNISLPENRPLPYGTISLDRPGGRSGRAHRALFQSGLVEVSQVAAFRWPYDKRDF